MDLRSAYPYWLLREGIINAYPSLYENKKTDIVIMGAGISGALVAWYLSKAGYKVIVVDKRHIGMGSTAASTGLLQYEIDTPLRVLGKKIGNKNAIESYLLCQESIHDLEKICRSLPDMSGFHNRPSFQFASTLDDIPGLKEEFNLRKEAGLNVELLDASSIKKKFGLDKETGILSETGAEINAYRLTHNLLKRCSKRGVEIFDHTNITRIIHHKRNVELITEEGHHIHARKLVIACGYESQRFLPKKVEQIQGPSRLRRRPLNG